ncbi:secretion/conjugation apparatus DotM-related subunit [Vibrio agarivorans]|uniref:secretion/conjugation apparatus DotM-related subunit n=1 Tax=Vibrio agarivorans TaxID=153622 RepID=UPI0025B301B1|nr:hypothetical protein [Vibrio agarivorans]MDN3661060.1 hypothetical protein [Vibrio agarivorans]
MAVDNDRNIMEDIKSLGWVLLAVAVTGYALFSKPTLLFTVWKYARFGELLGWHYLYDIPFNSDYFKNGVNLIWVTPPSEITWSFVFQFEAKYNHYLRFFYSIFFFVIGGKIIFNYLHVTRQLNVQSMIELWRHESEAIDVLADDNPIKSHRVYDFDNRDDYHNRHAQAMSPTQYLTANPPVNASDHELEVHVQAIEAGAESPYRPIAVIDHNTQSLDFSRVAAKQSLERQLTDPPVENPFYHEEFNAPRLFDQEGQLVPLEYNEEGLIVGGFATDKLLNNGRSFHGEPEDVALLFNGLEREVFYTLCDRYNNPSVPIEDVVLELTKRHAYSRTYLVALMRLVRKNSNVASTEFYLTCREDRLLYFTIYSASEEKPFYEAMGVMNHFHYENQLGRAIPFPCVDKAVNALLKDAKRIAGWTPDSTDVLTKLAHNLRDDYASPEFDNSITDEDIEGTLAALNENTTSDNVTSSGQAVVNDEVR